VEVDPECLFCDPVASDQEKDTLIYETADNDWSLRIFPNKFPAFARPKGGAMRHKEEGPYFLMESVGYHEVVVTRDHKKHIGQMDPLLVAELLDAYQTRYIELMNKKSVSYIDIFHNHGRSAGASIPHPHSQLMAIPVVSPYVKGELDGAEKYHRQNKKCVYCATSEWEREKGERMVFENEDFIVFCPFASRANFEMWVMPKKHKPYFERTSQAEKISGGVALREAVRKLSEGLNNPDFNFYIHTAPCDGRDYPHYHWHIEILPKLNTWAGFEISTGIEIITMSPEEAASFLRSK
jgi:UDPglucose--hexose-1-phosphate uridylyltransferase